MGNDNAVSVKGISFGLILIESATGFTQYPYFTVKISIIIFTQNTDKTQKKRNLRKEICTKCESQRVTMGCTASVLFGFTVGLIISDEVSHV